MLRKTMLKLGLVLVILLAFSASASANDTEEVIKLNLSEVVTSAEREIARENSILSILSRIEGAEYQDATEYQDAQPFMWGPAAPIHHVEIVWLGLVQRPNGEIRVEIDLWVIGSGNHTATSTLGATSLISNIVIVPGGPQAQQHIVTFDIGPAIIGNHLVETRSIAHNIVPGIPLDRLPNMGRTSTPFTIFWVF